MALKEILVHLDHTPGCHARLEVAISLAQKHQAHLTGLYATDSPYHSPSRPGARAEVKKVETLFREGTARAGVSAAWRAVTAEESLVGITERVILHAYYSDLVVVGQADTGSGHRLLSEQVALGSGRPVLIVPSKGEFKTVGERVMVAWRCGKASSRALNDALPLLKHARQVNVVRVNPQEDFETDVRNLRTYLEFHGIKSVANKLIAEDIRIGDLLLNQACDLGADLVVMGIFPSGRMGTSGSGPIARHFLEHMTIPVLMSG